ncbi:hypothetical protein CesoFtcFv8_013748 [Champsocephalus esox]|uniref:Uncharacterized protein n=2 Tax=Champsocephalus TaxID=52236 RepID=A0AAN8DDG9_CHAGU|nr:hypothetical protein CesoFtcFv8_013748 [Champsocephalus esox]KAK5920716.1 hypothetical protein CgunFtcFv8_024497 [Champsocephalus gunnari]
MIWGLNTRKLPQGTQRTYDLYLCPDVVPQGPVEQRGHNNRSEPTGCEHSHGTPGSERRTGRASGPRGKGECAGGEGQGSHGVFKVMLIATDVQHAFS